MSDIKLIIDGKEYICRPVEKETDAAERGRPRTGYERVNEEQEYYTVYNDFYDDMSEENMQEDDENYSVGNYYNDEQLAVDIARAETLMRRMRQWQALNDDVVDWNDEGERWCITYGYIETKLSICRAAGNLRGMGEVYFSSSQAADKARDIFRDELMWYFTEYRQRLDEPKVK